MTDDAPPETDAELEAQAAQWAADLDAPITTPKNGHRPNNDPIPHELAAEQAALGAMLTTRRAIDDATTAGLTADHYYKPAHQHLHHTLVTMAGAGAPIELVAVAAELRHQNLLDDIGGETALLDLYTHAPSTTNTAHYAQLIIRAHHLRSVIAAGTAAQQAARKGDLDAAITHLQQAVSHPAANHKERIARGGTWLLDVPDTTPAVWGTDDQVLWAEGEPLMIVAPPGVGKTTLAGQIVAGRLGITDQVLGWPITPCKKLLYLACDRPRQIARSLHRVFTGADRDHLDEHLAIWEGPPPNDFATHPNTLVDLAHTNGADTIVIDSLKDVAVGLTDDEVGASLNRAIQTAIADGIEVLSLHHQRKGQNGTKPKTLEDVYGSTWITAGAGSVILLWGKAGDLIIELEHLKQPADNVGPLKLEHDHATGRTTVFRGMDLYRLLRNAPKGFSATEVARLIFEKSDVTDNQKKQALRKLNALVDKGLVHRTELQRGGTGGTEAVRFVAVEPHAE